MKPLRITMLSLLAATVAWLPATPALACSWAGPPIPASFTGIGELRRAGDGLLIPEQEAALAAAFGPPIEVTPSAWTRGAAWAQIWWLPALLIAVAGWFFAFPLPKHVVPNARTSLERFRAIPLLIGWGLALLLPIANDLARYARLELGTMAAILLLMAAAIGTALSPAIATMVTAMAVAVVGLWLPGRFGESPFRGVTFAADRISFGAVLVMVGLGVLAMCGRHPARWPAAVATISGRRSQPAAWHPWQGIKAGR